MRECGAVWCEVREHDELVIGASAGLVVLHDVLVLTLTVEDR